MESSEENDQAPQMWRCQNWNDTINVAQERKEDKSTTLPVLVNSGTNCIVSNVSPSATLMESKNSINHQTSNQNEPKIRSEPYKSYKFSSKNLLYFINRDKTSATSQVVEKKLRTPEKSDASQLSEFLSGFSKGQSGVQKPSIKPHGNKNYRKVDTSDLEEINRNDLKPLKCGNQEKDTTLQVSQEMKSMSKEKSFEYNKDIRQHKKTENSLVQNLGEVDSDYLEDDAKNKLEYNFWQEMGVLDTSEAMEIGSKNQENESLLSVIHPENKKIIFPQRFEIESTMNDPEELQKIKPVSQAECRLCDDIDKSNLKVLETVSIENEVSDVMEIDSNNHEKKHLVSVIHPENNEMKEHKTFNLGTRMCNSEELQKIYSENLAESRLCGDIDNSSINVFETFPVKNKVSEVMEIDSKDEEKEQLLSLIHSENNDINDHQNFNVKIGMNDPEELQKINTENLVECKLQQDIDTSNIKVLERVSIKNKVLEVMEIDSKNQENETLLYVIHPENNEINYQKNFNVDTGMYDAKELLKINEENPIECRHHDDIDNSNIKVLETVPIENEVSDVLDKIVGDVEEEVEKQKEFLKHLEIGTLGRHLNKNSEVVERSHVTLSEKSNVKDYVEKQNAFMKQTEIIEEATNYNFPSTILEKDAEKRACDCESSQIHSPVKKVEKIQLNVQRESEKSVKDKRGKKRKISPNNILDKRNKTISTEEQENKGSQSENTKQIVDDDRCPTPLILRRKLRDRPRPKYN